MSFFVVICILVSVLLERATCRAFGLLIGCVICVFILGAICVLFFPSLLGRATCPAFGFKHRGLRFLIRSLIFPLGRRGDQTFEEIPRLAGVSVHLSKDIIGAQQAWKAPRSLNPIHPKYPKTSFRVKVFMLHTFMLLGSTTRRRYLLALQPRKMDATKCANLFSLAEIYYVP